MGKDFFPEMPPTNMYKDKLALEKMENYYKILTKFNVYLDAVVQRKNNYLLITNTKINKELV